MAKTTNFLVTEKTLVNGIWLQNQSLITARSRKEALETLIERKDITLEVYEPAITTTPESASRTVGQ